MVPVGSRVGYSGILVHVSFLAHGPKCVSFHLGTQEGCAKGTSTEGGLASPLFAGLSLVTVGRKVVQSELPTPLPHTGPRDRKLFQTGTGHFLQCLLTRGAFGAMG